MIKLKGITYNKYPKNLFLWELWEYPWIFPPEPLLYYYLFVRDNKVWTVHMSHLQFRRKPRFSFCWRLKKLGFVGTSDFFPGGVFGIL
jgi:hypothetical protein